MSFSNSRSFTLVKKENYYGYKSMQKTRQRGTQCKKTRQGGTQKRSTKERKFNH